MIDLRFVRPVRRRRLRRRLVALVRRLRPFVVAPVPLRILVVPHDAVETPEGFGFGVYESWRRAGDPPCPPLQRGGGKWRLACRIFVATNCDMRDRDVAFVLCHELAHYEQDLRCARLSGRAAEREADRRAVELLEVAGAESLFGGA